MECIREWVSYNNDNFDNFGKGSGDGYGYGYGDGSGSGRGSGSGSGDGDGDGYGDGYGYGYGDGSGNSIGYGVGSGCDSGYGYDNGNGYGAGREDFSIVRLNGQDVYNIDGILTVIFKVRGNVAHGGIVQQDLSLVPCYVVRGEGYYAHGETLAEARDSLMEKILEGKSEEERIAEFIKHFPKGKTQKGTEYYEWHHILTGSCKMGRDEFVKSRGLDLSKEYAPEEFIQLTKGSYGGEIIKKLEKAYA